MFIRERYGNRIEDSRFAPEADLEGHVDLKRLIEGRVGGIFLSAYVGWSVTVRAHYLVGVLIAPQPQGGRRFLRRDTRCCGEDHAPAD